MKIAVGTTFQRIHAHSLLRQLVQLPIAFTAVVEGGGSRQGMALASSQETACWTDGHPVHRNQLTSNMLLSTASSASSASTQPPILSGMGNHK